MNNLIRETIRTLRKNCTHAENIFWESVRNRRVLGCKFFRQHPVRFIIDGKKRFFIADFYCAEHKLVVEIDGAVHERQKDYDELRTFIMENKRLRVIRIKNEDVERDVRSVINTLKTLLAHKSSQR